MAKKLKEHQLLLVNNFAQYKGTKKDYCVQNNVNYRTFINWCNKLKLTNIQQAQSKPIEIGTKQKSKFIKFKLPLSETIKVQLPNGIGIEIVSNNLSTIIKELVHAI